MINYYPLLCICILVSFGAHSQDLSALPFAEENRKLLAEVKQLDQFIKRFNNKEYILTGKEKSIAEVKKETEDVNMFQTERKKGVVALLNFNDTSVYNKRNVAFINYVGEESNHIKLSYYDSDWYALVGCAIIYKGKQQNISVTLKVEGNFAMGFKWVIAGVNADFIDFLKISINDTTKFISPMNHELGFMDLYKVFQDYQNISAYIIKDYPLDKLSIFKYLVSTKEIQYIKVNTIQYHFLQIKDWVFTVDYFNRPDYNSGWLISSISKIPDSEKTSYKADNLFLIH